MEYAVEHAPAVLNEDNNEDKDEGIQQTLYLGWNRAHDTLLEVVVLHFDDGRDTVIHAMKMQRRYTRFLPQAPRDA